MSNWSNAEERDRVCLIFAGKALRDDTIRMSRIGLKEGDTMHAFYKNPPDPTTQSNRGQGQSSNQGQSFDDEDDFDELARYFLPLAGSLLSKSLMVGNTFRII